MNSKGKDIVQELKEIAPGLNLPSTPPYRAPEGYFDALPDQVLQHVRAADARTAQEELDVLSPLLGDIPRQQLQRVPAGYFEGLPDRILGSITTLAAPEATAKIVPARSRQRYLSWVAAACFIGFIGLGALFLLRQNTGTTTSSLEVQLGSISDQEIIDYLQTRSDAFDNEAIISGVSSAVATDELPRISTNLNDLPADAIENYLENAGWSN